MAMRSTPKVANSGCVHTRSGVLSFLAARAMGRFANTPNVRQAMARTTMVERSLRSCMAATPGGPAAGGGARGQRGLAALLSHWSTRLRGGQAQGNVAIVHPGSGD